MVTQYLAILDPPHEALLSLGVDREWGGTGTRRIGASPKGATSPTVYFAKGMGDLDLGYLRPFAVTGSIGYQFADAPPAPRQPADRHCRRIFDPVSAIEGPIL